MPAAARPPSAGGDPDQSPTWIALAAMFTGQPLDRRAAVGAYVAAAATLAVSVLILLANHH